MPGTIVALLLAVVVGAGGNQGLEIAPPPAGASAPPISSNDFPSIQAAIDSLELTGGAVRIPAGLHLLPAKVRVYSNITVFGDGMDQTILKFAPGVADHMLSNASLSKGNANITVRDLTLQGQKTSKTDCCYGLRLVNVRDVTVINVASDGFSKDGFYLGYYRDLGAYNVRLSGCRATNNGRNGISLTHGTGNVIDHCLIERNNRSEQVAGIDLEPDEGQNVSDNKVVANAARGQNVGIQLFAFDRAKVTMANNAICDNLAAENKSAGIAEDNGTANIYVNNTTTKNGTNFSVDKSAKIGPAYASACALSPLPGVTATPTATTGATSTPTATPTATATPTVTPTPVPRTVTTRRHSLEGSVQDGKRVVTATVEVQNALGAPVSGAQVTLKLTGPDGTKTVRPKTNASGVAKAVFKVKRAGTYATQVSGIGLKGSSFVPGPNDLPEPRSVTLE